MDEVSHCLLGKVAFHAHLAKPFIKHKNPPEKTLDYVHIVRYYITKNSVHIARIQEDTTMTVKEIAFKQEELQTKAWALNSLALAVSDAIIEGPNDASNFEGALHILLGLARELEGEMKEIGDALFEIIRDEKKEVA